VKATSAVLSLAACCFDCGTNLFPVDEIGHVVDRLGFF